MDQTNPHLATLRAEARAGLRDIAPAAIAAVPISLLFGAVAIGKGLSPLDVGLMSALVFAGGAQFAASRPGSIRLPCWPSRSRRCSSTPAMS